MSGSLFEQYKAALRRGHLAALAGQLDEALQAYRAASRLVPERTLPIASEGTVLHQLDRWPEAAEAFDRALTMAPDDEVTLRARASAREQRGMRSGAAADLERLAFVLDVAGRAAEAADAARRAAQLEHSATRATLAARLALTATHDADHVPPGPAPAPARTPAPAVAPAPAALAAQPAPADFAAVEAELVAAPGAPPAAAPTPAWLEHAAAAAPGSAVAEAAPEPAPSIELEGGPEGQSWPAIDLPSPAPAPIVGPPPDPETLLAEAAAHIRAGELAAARDLMLTAAMIHRSAGRLDAALEACLQLLGIAPGDPYVHLAIANLQLDRGWTGIATEKLELLLRLTSLTGATQAEADVHGLAAERLRDDPVGSVATR